jgi:hypothetical protein
MKELIEIYNLKNDFRKIQMIQEVSLDKKSFAGFKVENSLLFGTKKWFTAIEKGDIKSYIVKGIVNKVLISGHNDFPEFEIKSDIGISKWFREGNDEAYKLGNSIKLVYVIQKYKRPSDITGSIAKCVLKIEI